MLKLREISEPVEVLSVLAMLSTQLLTTQFDDKKWHTFSATVAVYVPRPVWLDIGRTQ